MMTMFDSGFMYLLVTFVAFCAFFSFKNKSIKLSLIGVMFLFYWLSTTQYEEYKNSEEGKENFRLGKNRALCQERFAAEVLSYGLNFNRFKFYNLSPISPDYVTQLARGGVGLPDYNFTCLLEPGTSTIIKFWIYAE